MLPLMSTGATDGIFFQAIGIPVYGAPGIFVDADLERHPRPERADWTKSLYQEGGTICTICEGLPAEDAGSALSSTCVRSGSRGPIPGPAGRPLETTYL